MNISNSLVVSPNGFGFRSDTGEVFRLNATACDVLAWLEEGEDEPSIAQRLVQRHDLPLLRIRADLSSFLEHLENLNILHRHENQ
ncbi:hypothetical protein BH09VER1_BH09VER1_39440 [soil metagenome]